MGDLHSLIAFDLDGTLIDSRRDLAESANVLIVERGGAPLAEEAVGRMVGEGAALLVRRALAAAGLDDTPDAVGRFIEIYEKRLLKHTHLFDGVVDAVRLARRHARVALLTNKPTRPSEQILAGLGIADLFDGVVGGDGRHGRKPDPAGLQALMQAAGAGAARTLLVGDSWIDHETARRAGVRCCLVSFENGFQPFPEDRLSGDEWMAGDAAALCAAIEQFAAEATAAG